MPLEDYCQTSEGTLTCVVPIGGYGWSRFNSIDYVDRTDAAPPKRFGMRILKFYRMAEGIAGGNGMIEDEDCPLNGMCVFFWIRDCNGELQFDMTTNLARYDIWIGNEKPKVTMGYFPPSAERAQFQSPPIFQGCSYIGESLKALRAAGPWLGGLLL